MKLKRLADDTPGFTTEDKNLITPEYYTEAQTDAGQHALELVTSAAMQSGLRFRKVFVQPKQGYETIVLDASDAEAVVLQSIYTDLNNSDYDYEHGTTEHDQDIVTISMEREFEDLEEEDDE